ncbi:MAG: hypothetical protein WC476_00340 [Phycisphaerae bacterium]|jgi:hypothetical protein
MLTEKKKKALIIILTVGAILIGVIPFLDHIFPKGEEPWPLRWLRAIKYFAWAWFPVFVLSTSAIAGTLYWKPGTLLLRVLAILFSAVAVIWSLLWLFGIIVISTLKF